MCIRDRLLHASHTTAQSGDWLIQQIQGITDVKTVRIAACPQGLSSPVRGLQAVSYTHLDVYKRQALHPAP